MAEYGENEPTVIFDFGESDGCFVAYTRCPKCGRFLSTSAATCGKNGLDEVRFAGFICSKHGEVQPDSAGWFSHDELDIS